MESPRDGHSSDESGLTEIKRLYELRHHYNKLNDRVGIEMGWMYPLDVYHNGAALKMKAMMDAGDEIDVSLYDWHCECAKKCSRRYRALKDMRRIYQRKLFEINREISLLDSDDN